MALFTGKGDDGTTKTFGCDQRVSKSSAIAEALGSLDEVNSFLGIVKNKCLENNFKIGKEYFYNVVHEAQENLFIIQAQVAGADKQITDEKIIKIEDIINKIEKELPPIKTFFISGASEIGSLFDFARTLVRRAERRAVAVSEENLQKISPNTLKYLNRLSSLFYALARYSNYLSGAKEKSPEYK
jgi:cob(I)alamin adenosyltransferase